MTLTWLCPTWNRPACVRQLITQFLAQDYPRDKLQLLIIDDAGQYDNQSGPGWQLISFNRRFTSLPEKYNAMLGMVRTDGIVIAEDDDLYSPQHSAACAAALAQGNVSKPSVVRVQYGPEHTESDPGRFHASLAIRTEFLRSIGGWPVTRRADFDLQLISKLRETGTKLIDPCELGYEPTYTFRWETSGHYHAQAYGHGPGDPEYYDRAAAASGSVRFVGELFS